MQEKMKYMNVQQDQQRCTAFAVCCFYTIGRPLVHGMLYVRKCCQYGCTVYLHIMIHSIYFIWVFCSLVFVYAGHGDFRTKSRSHVEFFFIPLGENKHSRWAVQTYRPEIVTAPLQSLASHAAYGSYSVHLVSEAAAPRRGPGLFASRFVSSGHRVVVK